MWQSTKDLKIPELVGASLFQLVKHRNSQSKESYSSKSCKLLFILLSKHMTKLIKIILWILIAVIIILITYSAAIQNKVNAQQEIIDQQQPIVDAANRISELEDLIKEEQTKYQLALDSKKECEVSWTKQMNKAHEKADEYRAEQLKLQGLILNR